MKAFASIQTAAAIFIAAACTVCEAEDWVTTDGKTYKNVQVITHNGTTVTISDDNGGATIPLSLLSGDLQKKFNYESVKTQNDQDAILDERVRERADQIRQSIKTVKEVTSAQTDFVGKPFYFQGTIDVSSYYNYGYDNAQTTHYAFKFVDRDGGTATLYMAKGADADDLRARILREGQPVTGLFSVVILPSRFDKDSSSLLLELTQATFGSD